MAGSPATRRPGEADCSVRAMASAPDWQERGEGRLPGFLGIEVVSVGSPTTLRLTVQPHHLAPNGFLHAATVVALADTACGYGCMESLPSGAVGFTTLETKSNHLATMREGVALGQATIMHSGRTTQVWDATVVDEQTTKTIAIFRCTQLVLYP